MTVLRFPQPEPLPPPEGFLAATTSALDVLRVLLESGYDLGALAADPKARSDAETVVAILECEVVTP